MDRRAIGYLKMDEKLIQKVFELVSIGLPEKHGKVIFVAYETKNAFQICYYTEFGDGKYISCYDVGVISDDEILIQIMEIHKYIDEMKNKGDKTQDWTCMTILFDEGGKYDIKYDYQDYSDRIKEYELEWRNRYLI